MLHKRVSEVNDIESHIRSSVNVDDESGLKGHAIEAFRSSRQFRVTKLVLLVVSVISLIFGIGIGIYLDSSGLFDKFKNSCLSNYYDFMWATRAKSFATIAEGFAKSPLEPFIVHNAKEFEYLPYAYALKEIAKHPDWKVYGNNEYGEKVEDINLNSLVKMFQKEELNILVFESPVQMFSMPKSLKENHVIQNFERDDPNYVLLYQTPVLSRKDLLTSWHMDPLVYGGGWMYIWEGVKDWSFHEPWMAPFYYNASDENFPLADHSTQTFARAVNEVEDFSIYKEVYPEFRITPFKRATAKAGDFVYFPPGWIHRVHTVEKTFGIGGYIRPAATLPFRKRVDEYFDAFEIKGSWNPVMT